MKKPLEPNLSPGDEVPLVTDITMHTLGRLEEPIEIEIDEGRIADIAAGHQGRELEQLLEEYGDEDVYKMSIEFSNGTNPEACVTVVQREDKVMLGCIHVGLDTNTDVGGEITSKLHMDGIIDRPIPEIDREVKIDDGEISPRLPLTCDVSVGAGHYGDQPATHSVFGIHRRVADALGSVVELEYSDEPGVEGAAFVDLSGDMSLASRRLRVVNAAVDLVGRIRRLATFLEELLDRVTSVH